VVKVLPKMVSREKVLFWWSLISLGGLSLRGPSPLPLTKSQDRHLWWKQPKDLHKVGGSRIFEGKN